MATATLLNAAGALATLFSAALTLRHERKNWRDRFGALVTFGAPRVGNAAFAKMTQRGLRHLLDGGPEKTARVAHCNDIIPHLPPSGLSEGFVHFGRWACCACYLSAYLQADCDATGSKQLAGTCSIVADASYSGGTQLEGWQVPIPDTFYPLSIGRPSCTC